MQEINLAMNVIYSFSDIKNLSSIEKAMEKYTAKE